MPYRFQRSETVADGVRRIACEQIDRAIAEIEDSALDRHAAVHQVRKRCKKIRGLIRLVRPQFEKTYQRENAHFRDTARVVADLRDARSMIECYDRLMQYFDDQVDRRQFASVRGLLTRRLKAAAREQDLDERLDDVRSRLQSGRARACDWEIPGKEFAVIAGGWKKTCGRARKALHRAYDKPTPENFHEWRKRAKYHRYHCKLLRSIWPDVMNACRDTADRLGDCLGDDHDLAIFRALLTDDADAFGDAADIQALQGLIDRRQRQLQASALPWGLRLFDHKPKQMARWYARCWKIWRDEKAMQRRITQT